MEGAASADGGQHVADLLAQNTYLRGKLAAADGAIEQLQQELLASRASKDAEPTSDAQGMQQSTAAPCPRSGVEWSA